MKFFLVDCFAQQKYQGNQLAVFLPKEAISEEEMQQIAKEIGFSETSFILSDQQTNGGYDVRIFSPVAELPFAGHPTIGTAFIIHNVLQQGIGNQVSLNLPVGQIPVYIKEGEFIMSQNQPEFGEILPKEKIIHALSLNQEHVRDDVPIQWVSTGLEAIIAPLTSIEALKQCRVNDTERQRFIDEHYRCSILVFFKQGNELYVRVFMEIPGFLEDAATGSANGNLAAYLLKYQCFHNHHIEYEVNQGCEMGRASKLHICASLVQDTYTIEVGGKVHIVAEGNWK